MAFIRRLQRRIGGPPARGASLPVVEAQTAEFGADSISARFRPLATSGAQVLLTGTPTVDSGDATGYVASISGDGGLVFDVAGGPDGVVYECTRLDGGGTVLITIEETAGCKVVDSMSDGGTAASDYETADDTATVAVAFRDGTYAATGDLDRFVFSSTDITGIGETRGTKSPSFNGGNLTYRPASGERTIITGRLRPFVAAQGIALDGLEFQNAADTAATKYEPESDESIIGLTVGETTTVQTNHTTFVPAQIQVGDFMQLESLSAPHDVLNGGPYEVVSFTDNGDGTVDFELDLDSTGLAAWSSGGILTGYGVAKVPNPTMNLQVEGDGPYLIQNCYFNNREMSPFSPGAYPHCMLFEMASANNSKVVTYNNRVDGCEHYITGGTLPEYLISVDDFIIDFWGDTYAMRDTAISDEWALDDTAGSITGISVSAGVATVTTSGAHGLSAGDCILIRDVTGMTEINNSGRFANTNGGTRAAECFYVSPNNLTSTAFEVQEQKGADDLFQDVDASGFTAYSSGGTVYGPIFSNVWIEGAVMVHGSPRDQKAKHSDAIQFGGNGRANQKIKIYDVVHVASTVFGFGTQGLLGGGGNDDPTYIEGEVKGCIFMGTDVAQLAGPKCRTAENSTMKWNTALRIRPLSFPGSPVEGKFAAVGTGLGILDGNIIGSESTSTTQSSPRDNLEVAQDDTTTPTYADVFPDGGFVEETVEGVDIYTSPDLEFSTKDLGSTRAEVRASVIALLTPADAYKGYGATADPDGPDYVADPNAAVSVFADLGRSTDNTNSSSSSLTPGITSGHASKVAIAAIFTESSGFGNGPSSVTIGGATATKLIGTVPTSTTYDGTVTIWIATLGGSPTDAIAVTHNDVISACAADTLIIDDAATTASDTDETERGDSTTNTLTASIDTPENGFLFMAGLATGMSTTPSAFTGSAAITEIEDADLEQGRGATSAYRADGVARTGETITWTIGANEEQRMVAVSLAKAS